MKDVFYFTHDANAQHDPKTMHLIDDLGPAGYGIYWMLLEAMRTEESYRLPLDRLTNYARRFNSDLETLKKVIHDFDLFVIEDNEFFSPSFIRRMEEMNERRNYRSQNGKKGGRPLKDNLQAQNPVIQNDKELEKADEKLNESYEKANEKLNHKLNHKLNESYEKALKEKKEKKGNKVNKGKEEEQNPPPSPEKQNPPPSLEKIKTFLSEQEIRIPGLAEKFRRWHANKNWQGIVSETDWQLRILEWAANDLQEVKNKIGEINEAHKQSNAGSGTNPRPKPTISEIRSRYDGVR
jgi:hypothetical protein